MNGVRTPSTRTTFLPYLELSNLYPPVDTFGAAAAVAAVRTNIKLDADFTLNLDNMFNTSQFKEKNKKPTRGKETPKESKKNWQFNGCNRFGLSEQTIEKLMKAKYECTQTGVPTGRYFSSSSPADEHSKDLTMPPHNLLHQKRRWLFRWYKKNIDI